MRPKLNAHTNYILMPDGIYLRSNGASLVLRGKNLDPFLELLPTLNGNHTQEELTQGLSADKKMSTIKFLETLQSAGFLKDTSQEQSPTLTQTDLTTYAPDIAFIDSLQTSAASHFASFRAKQLLVIGSGLSLTALIQASLRCGVKRINMIRTPECDTNADSQSDRLDLFSLSDPEQKVQAITVPQWDNEIDVLNTINACDVLLHISDCPMLARAQMLNRLCIEQKKTFIQAIIVGDHAWVGPLISPETGGCWECAWRRHLATGSEQDNLSAFRDDPTTSISQYLSSATAAMVANRLIFELFKHFTQAGPVESAGGLIDIDLETLLCERCVFLPHPHCDTCQHPIVPIAVQFLDRMQQLQHQAPLDPTTLCENIVQDVEHRLGLFTALDTNNFVQAPLAVYKVGLSNPMHLSTQSKALEVIGVGTDRTSAKSRACQRACERYAASFVDPQKLLHRETIQRQALPTIPVDQLIGASALSTEVETWTWALDLHSQQACLLPAPLAYPSLQHGELRAEDERGIGSGMSWAEAICQALFDLCTFLAIEQVSDAQRRYAQVDLTTAPMSPEGTYLYRLLQALSVQVTVYDVTGPLQIPTFAICIDQKVVAYSTHCDVAEALSAGLRQALQHYQATQAQEPEYAVVPVPDLPMRARADRKRSGSHDNDRWDMPDQTTPVDWPARQEDLLQTLHAHGLHAWALPLDHDPALVQIFPYIVRVVLTKI